MIDARRVQTHFDHVAVEYDRWKARAAYYYAWLARLLRERAPRGGSALDKTQQLCRVVVVASCAEREDDLALLPVRQREVHLDRPARIQRATHAT